MAQPSLPPLDVGPDDTDEALVRAVLAHWRTCLLEGEGREAILRNVGVSGGLALRLGLGFSDCSLGRRIPDRQVKAGRALRSRLERLGIVKHSGHEAFRGCVTVPVTDASGAVVGIFGLRADRHFVGPAGHVWAGGLPGAVFGTVAEDGPTLVVATIADALAVMGAGWAAVVASGRAQGFNAAELRRLATCGHELVTLGRGAVPIAESLVTRGGSVAVAAPSADLQRTLPMAPDRTAALAALVKDRPDTDRGVKGPEPGIVGEAPDPAPPPPPARPEGAQPEGPRPGAPRSEARHPAPVRIPVVATTEHHTERDEVFVRSGPRSWRIRGAGSRANTEGDLLRVALMVTDTGSGRFHLDTFDLYAARARSVFLEAATTELRAAREVLALELAEVLAAAERARDEAGRDAAQTTELTEAELAEAMTWLTAPDLLDRLRADLGALGVVGEETNLLVSYLSVTSRLCERPFGVLVQSSSAAGKSTLADAVCALVPQDQLVSLSAITAQALYYCSGGDLAHKVLSVAEDQGATRAAYALKLLVSEGRLSIAATGKDRRSGALETRSYETRGPVALLMTTTATDLDPELENRLVVLGVDEDPAQTQAILAAQQRAVSVAGFLDRARRDEVRRRHRALQRLLTPYPVCIPDTDVVFPATATRHRRDHQKLLSIVSALTVLHQHQRERKTLTADGVTCTYLEATDDDVAGALSLAQAVLVRGPDHLAPHTRRLLAAVRQLTSAQASERGCAPEEIAVTRRELRGMLGWSEVQVRRATDRLVALEYLVTSGGGRGRCRTYATVAGLTGVGQEWSPVGHPGRPTTKPSSPGETPQFVRFVGLDDPHEELHRVGGDVPGALPGTAGAPAGGGGRS